MNAELLFFAIVSLVALASGILMVTRRNPVISALFLIVNFFCLSLLYLLLHAQFIAIIQILVYTGAIMVLFLFVIMLLNLGDEERKTEKKGLGKYVAIALALAALVELIVGVVLPAGSLPVTMSAKSVEVGTVESIGRYLFSAHVIPFEITSVLLLAAMVGVVMLAKRRIEE